MLPEIHNGLAYGPNWLPLDLISLCKFTLVFSIQFRGDEHWHDESVRAGTIFKGGKSAKFIQEGN